MVDETSSPEAGPQATIDINYLKTAHFREVSADGLLGAPTPDGKLWLAFYTERLPLPRIMRHALLPVSRAGSVSVDPEKPGALIEGRSGIVRNVEFGLYLSESTARQLHEWLGRHLETFDTNKSDNGGAEL